MNVNPNDIFSFELLDFKNANLTKANFNEAKLYFVDFDSAILDDATFQNSRLRQCFFIDSSLKRVNFSDSHIIGTRFTAANLSNTKFKYSDLQTCNFFKANAHKANFQNADLRSTFCDEAIFAEANLSNAKLQRASMSETVIEGAIIKGTNFSGSRLLSQQQIDLAHGDENTVLLRRMKRPEHWGQPDEYNHKQIPAPVKFIETEEKVDVDTPTSPDKEYSQEYKESLFFALRTHCEDFANNLTTCNVSIDTVKRAETLAAILQTDFDTYNAVLMGGKFRSFFNLIKTQWDALTDGIQFDFKELERNHLALEDMFVEAREYKRNSARAGLPDEGIPMELEEIIRSTIESKQARKLLTQAAQDKLTELGEESISNDPATIKERAMGLLTSFTNLSRVLESIVSKGSSIAESANQILLNSHKVLEWINTIIDKF